jgi:hypothetical protein
MARHHKVSETLSPEDFEALKAFVREKNLARTTDECHEWLLARGYTISRGATWNWLDSFRLEEKTQRAGDMARQYLDAARESDPNAVTEASLRKFEEKVFDWLVSDQQASADDLASIANAMRRGIGSRREVLELKRQQAEALAAGEKAAAEGKSAADVVSTIKTALGIAA